jgi:hypothetical protein
VKSALIATAAAAAMILPLPAAAQSLDDSHELVWHPSGKTPGAIYRQRNGASCSAAAGHHQAGKSAMPVAKKCAVEVAKAPAAATGGEPAVAR